MKKLLTTTSAAKLAGVGVSSIKRWADEGKLRTVRTPGGHRRLVHSDILSFVKDPEGHSILPMADKTGGEWADAILTMEFHGLQSKLLNARGRNGSWNKTMDELALGVQETGNRWANKSITIGEEHVASECLSRVLASIYESIPVDPNAPLCLLSSAEGDLHTLGLSMLQVVLRELGWRCLWLGAMTPLSEVCHILETKPVDMVALSASKASTNSVDLARQINEISGICQKTDTRLVVGGSGVWPEPMPHGFRTHDFGSLTTMASLTQ
jgi:MerR family transcriptional regulator, light-induced transcriptional regulator